MVLLKLSETVRPSSDEDFDLAVKKLEQLFGEFAFQTDQDFCDALKSEMRLLKDRSTLVSGGQVISVGREEFTEMLDRHWFQRSRLARLVHEYFGWTIYNLARPDGSGEEFGVRIGDTERYYVADIPPRVVHSPVVLRRSQENHIAASDGIMADVDDPTIYTRLILLCNDEVARAIKADVAWYGRVLDILSGENLLKQEELELGRYRPGHQ
ncbi:hypothetical protein RRU01S_13_00010 [Agrobacterium rubi TR3 = NBRC 13261]|uniref:Uncharacterized protein n=2 Tax=Agrobacterium rubi TaxID=28099 RepID=A0A081CVG7_9HYPH|nr:hypothetical protein RRU01S_13_00010 [Agrobacterium rubi TR3 = NBRC 13261]